MVLSKDDLDALVLRVAASGRVSQTDFDDVLAILMAYRESRKAFLYEGIKARNPDAIKLSEFKERVRDLRLPRDGVAQAAVDLGIGRWTETADGRTRLMFNWWETDYVASAAYYPGLLTPAGADALEEFLRTGKKAKLRGEPK